MNIFVLDEDPITAARMHCDKHVPKMCVEAAQMMASALRRHGATDEMMPLTKAGKPYKGGYKHHPCTVWAGDSRDNFIWLARHAQALLTEYSNRFDKVHACNGPIHIMSCKDYIIPEGGGGASNMKQADLTSQINSSRTTFTIPEIYQTGTIRVYYNGIRQVKNDHFTEPNQTQINLLFTPQTGDFLTVDYIPES